LNGEASEKLAARTNPIRIKSLTASATTASSISLEFSTQKRVTGYYVYRYDASAKKWKKIGTSTDGTFTDDTVAASTAYKYRVRAYKESGDVTYYGKYSSVLTVRSNPEKVKNLTASKTTSKSITLKFTTQKRVTGYEVYRYDASAGKWKKIGTSKDGTFTDDTVKASTSYKYRVRAYKTSGGVTYYGKYSKALTVRSNPDKVKSLTASKTTSKSISLKFTTQKRVTGYEVYRYNESTGKWKKLGTSKDGTFTDKTVKANTSYKYRVRAYKKSGGVIYYGKYSKALTIKSAKAKK
jgi:fibronectin type 3 domain-containing protein